MNNEVPFTLRYIAPLLGAVRLCATELTYADFPTYYTWIDKDHCWKRRVRPKKSDCVSRIYNLHPSDGEKLYLRLLLHHVTGAYDFDALKIVDNIMHSTFLDACKAHGLTKDDAEWKNRLRDACGYQKPKALRNLFAIIVINNSPTDVLQLYNLQIDETRTLRDFMAEDFLYQRKQTQNNEYIVQDETDVYECLLALDTYFRELSNGMKILQTYSLPTVHLVAAF